MDKISYVPIEYLQSDSTAYINTGIRGNDDELEITCCFEFNKYVLYGAIYSTYIDEESNATRCILAEPISDYNYRVYDNVNTKAGGASQLIYIGGIGRKVNYHSTKKVITVNNVVNNRISEKKGLENNKFIALFARNLDSSVFRDIGLKIYYFQISKNGEMLRDFIPVRVGNVGYMYDKVSKQLFGNVGSGEFILGQDL